MNGRVSLVPVARVPVTRKAGYYNKKHVNRKPVPGNSYRYEVLQSITDLLYNTRSSVNKASPNLYKGSACSQFFFGICAGKNTTRSNNGYLAVCSLMNIF